MEAIAVLEQRQAAEQAANDSALIAANAADIFDDGHSWVGGDAEGDVTLVEFFDYRCGYCRRAHPEVTELVESDGDIRIVKKEFPILGEQSLLSSRFAIAVRQVAGDAAYRAVHEALIALRGDLTEAGMAEIAGAAGLDQGQIDDVMIQMSDPQVDRIIAENRALAERLQINGTPTFVLEDRLLRGYVPLQEMRAIVEDVRAEG
jgi:protein-disulfide isomerase